MDLYEQIQTIWMLGMFATLLLVIWVYRDCCKPVPFGNWIMVWIIFWPALAIYSFILLMCRTATKGP